MKITSPLGPIIISVLVTIGFLCSVGLLLSTHINTSLVSGQAFLILMGVLAQSFAQVTNYWLGSSAGSAAKTQQLADLAAKP